MKLKLDENGNVVVQDGKPVYVNDAGKDIAFDVEGTTNTIARLNGEARAHREEKEAAQLQLKVFADAGIKDPSEAVKALQTVQSLDQKKLVDAGQLEELKKQLNSSWEEQLTTVRNEREQAVSQLNGERLGNLFQGSKFVQDTIAVPVDMVRAQFGQSFKFEDGKLAAYDASGNRIFSKANPGEPAGFDEALEHLVDSYPHKDSILKSKQNTGTGTHNDTGTGGGPAGGSKRVTRQQFDQMSPGDQSSFSKEGGRIAD